MKTGVAVFTTPSFDVPSVSETASVPAVGAVLSIVSDPEVVESAVVTVLPARSVTSARTLYVVLVVSAAAVTVYGPLPVKVALSVQFVPASLLTCRTTDEMAAVGALVPVYEVSAVPDAARLNAGVVELMIPSVGDVPVSVDVIVSVPAVGAVVSTVIRPFVVESAVVVVMPAVSVTNARTEYVPFVANAGDAVTVYAVAGEVGAVKVALSVQVDPSVLTCSTTLATAAVAAPVPV